MTATQEFGGNPSTAGSKNCRQPDQCASSDMNRMSLNMDAT